jgi:hypothetical protein
MIKVFLSINNNEDVLQLPVPPSSYRIEEPWNNEEKQGLQQSMNLIGLKGLRTISISSFFPIEGHDYPFLQNRETWGREYVKKIQSWRDKRYPVRLIITSDDEKQDVNMAVTINDFSHEVKRDGDIYYTLDMTEFAFVKVIR